jgi:hypothetical protein|tara:strand:- start:1226 stop:2206 length:981 start_codon:yes stop_codon:yes gene_type:complete
MANATSANLKLTVQATGENSGTWGQFTNTNLLILEQAIGGYDAVGITSGATLTFSNGVLSNGKNQVLKLTGTISGNVNVTIPDSIEKSYIIDNATTGAHTVTFKTSSGTGVTWGSTDKSTKIVYSDGTNVVDTGLISSVLSTDLDTNSFNIKFDDATGIKDDSSNEQLIFQKTSSAVNYFEMTNAATGNSPSISATGSDTNVGIDISTKGTGLIRLQNAAYNTEATLTDGATINWTVNTSPVAKVTLGGNRTLAAPTGGATGQFVSLLVIQDGTGSRTLTFNDIFEFTGNSAPTLTTASNKGDLFVFRYNGTKYLEVGRNLNLTLS